MRQVSWNRWVVSEHAEVSLSEVTEDDLEVFFEQQLDPEATAMAAFPARAHDEFFAHWHRILADETVTSRSVRTGGEVAGNVVAWTQDGHREIGYWIGRAFWGRGIATSALRQFLEVETERPLHAWVAKRNLGSIRVLEKCGFAVAVDQPSPTEGGDTHVLLELPA
jgi:RimJ/RimL family protein N-acetyltransferase